MHAPMKWIAIALAGATLAAQARPAAACGCFAPPSPTTPVVQAGERILFTHDGNQVTAYIQIQYQGAAAEFGWLVPLPSVPTLELGSDELFRALQARTNPQYSITTTRQFCYGGYATSSGGSGIGCGGSADEASYGGASDLGVYATDLAAASDAGESALVAKASIGPYDYAVLKADDKAEMLAWLDANRYYVPDATGAAVAPYIHPGAYFLALKLRAGENAGDVVPVVLRYASDLPMIPITLTQVGAIPDMGVLVWFLGEARAIPRNYYHVTLDEMPVWESLTSYPQQAIRAVHAAPGRHAFLTEYAGTSGVMFGQLDYAGRFGNLATLRSITSPISYLGYLRSNGYTFDGTLFAILERYLPLPPELAAMGVTEAKFYGNYPAYASFMTGADGGAPEDTFDPVALTNDLEARVVRPLRAAAALFVDHPYLTRMYTALSPEDMNLDPVFSENPDLPDVSSQHGATLTVPAVGDAWLRTEQGREEQWVSSLPPNKIWPAAERVERLREAGDPDVVVDNGATIATKLGPVDHGQATCPAPQSPPPDDRHRDGCACDVRRGVPSGALGTFVLVAGAILLARRRRYR